MSDLPPSTPARKAPGPRGRPLTGNLFEMRKDVLGMVLNARREFGDVVRFRIGTTVIHLLCHPDHIRHVLVENPDRYDKGTRSGSKIESITGAGLLTANGDAWRRQRRLMTPAFHPNRCAEFVPMMADVTARVIEAWRPYAERKEPIDVASEMMRLTYTVVGRALFGSDVTADIDAVEDAAAVIMEHTYHRLESVIDPPDAVPTRRNRRFRQAMETVDAVVRRITTARNEAAAAVPRPGDVQGARRPRDLLSLLLQEWDEETGTGLAAEQVRNEVVTLLLAGHETTANALTWTWYLLSKFPQAARQAREEVQRVIGDRTPKADELGRLEYTTRVIQESMRLYPPIWVMERRALADDVIGGYAIPAGSTVVLCPWVTHRHPDFWDNPEGFDPDRFLPAACDARPHYAYFPFGGGPRYCIGSAFAMTEAKLIVAMVARAYRLDLVPGFPVEPKPGITLRAKDAVRMTVHHPLSPVLGGEG